MMVHLAEQKITVVMAAAKRDPAKREGIGMHNS
jgi:hypothetical protein